jgi:hypothetical protein
MPPRLYSRHTSTTMLSDGSESSNVILTDRKRFPYKKLGNNISHIVAEGDTWHRLASTYYAGLTKIGVFSAAQLWWVIADFQPDPVHDPTIVLAPGTVVVVPALDTVLGTILNPNERLRLGV